MQREIDGVMYEVPTHMAVIMDGNGRWAKKRMMPRMLGHRQGAKVLEQSCEDVWNLGVKYFTVYAFSTENWKRSQEEIAGIMDLLRTYLKDLAKKCNKNNMRMRFIGDRSVLDQDIQDKMREVEEESAQNDGLQFTVALNYGGRDELRRMTMKLAEQVKKGELDASEITEELISRNLDTCELPDPDLLVRTSGEERISNYLLWQLAYAEFYFTDVLWPDMNRKQFIEAIKYYSGRDRRYGGAK
ncbi:MAG: isoprenyl transferase [Eubacterium sp.]|nr:isoprenyl transferase [Eubacterium sp.]MBR6171935.1 isoprenyl transferase [Eubacterium sp.]